MATTTYEIYSLSDPRESGPQSVHYIGATKHGKHRLSQHICWAKLGRSGPSYDWVRELLTAGEMPTMTVLCRTLTVEKRDALEATWIRHYRELGAPLTNRSEGFGTLGYRHTPEALVKMSEVKKGKPVQPETLQKAIAANLGRTYSEEHRAHLSEAAKRRYADPEARSKTSEAGKRGWITRKKT